MDSDVSWVELNWMPMVHNNALGRFITMRFG